MIFTKSICSPQEFEALLASVDGRVPDAEEYQRFGVSYIDLPDVGVLNRLDPFSPEYHERALGLYLTLRGRTEGGYEPTRDEANPSQIPTRFWSDLAPWGFRDPLMVGEHLYSWGHMLRHLALPAGGSVLEYGPGSGQLLLMLARMGFRACGVDVDAGVLDGIRLQADGMNLEVPTERAVFGEGFDDERFDCVVFYEAFHHALDFRSLLARLRDRIKPCGRLVLCGEPIVPAPFGGIPYPWGPRLDALSIFCMRKYGWMELGFIHDFFVEAARRSGWQAEQHAFAGCGRAHLYVLRPADGAGSVAAMQAPQPGTPAAGLDAHIAALQAELQEVYASTSWRLTRPLRWAGRWMNKRRSSAVTGH